VGSKCFKDGSNRIFDICGDRNGDNSLMNTTVDRLRFAESVRPNMDSKKQKRDDWAGVFLRIKIFIIRSGHVLTNILIVPENFVENFIIRHLRWLQVVM
jgi:hypothetical protein